MTRLVRLETGRAEILPGEVTAALGAGAMVIYPTDTLYGLGVDPSSADGLARLVAAKGREWGKPIPLLLSDRSDADRWARRIPDGAYRLMRRFWPGALTLVLPSVPGVHSAITGGGDTVGVRLPDHPVPRRLAEALGGAITGTSANRSGNSGAWTCAEEILREFGGEVDWVLWDGPAPRPPGEKGVGGPAESTVVRMVDDRPALLREGAIPFRDITEFLKKG